MAKVTKEKKEQVQEEEVKWQELGMKEAVKEARKELKEHGEEGEVIPQFANEIRFPFKQVEKLYEKLGHLPNVTTKEGTSRIHLNSYTSEKGRERNLYLKKITSGEKGTPGYREKWVFMDTPKTGYSGEDNNLRDWGNKLRKYASTENEVILYKEELQKLELIENAGYTLKKEDKARKEELIARIAELQPRNK